MGGQRTRERNPRAWLLWGPSKNLRGAPLLIRQLLLTSIIWLVILWVKLILRAIYITATFELVRECTMLSILCITLGLRVSAGLLNSTIPGRTVREWVTVICRRRLLESRFGNPRVRLRTFICLRSRTVILRVPVPG